MIALLLSAGFGTRLGSLTKVTPKCLIKVGDRALIDYWINMLNRNDISKIVVNTHYLAPLVKSHLNYLKNPKLEIFYEKKLLGTLGTLKQIIKIYDPEEICVIHADNFSIFNYDEFYKSFKKRVSNAHITMMTFCTSSPESCGIIKLKNNIVIDFFEKIKNPPSNLANGAIYFMDKSAINEIKLISNASDISKDLIPLFLGRINCFHNSIYHCDIGDPESLENTNAFIKKNKNLLLRFFPGL